MKAYFAAFRRAVPDLHAQVHDMLADGDKVVTRKTFHGTHTGEFMGLPATGNAISVDVIDIVRVRDGKFVEHWNVLDTLALMRQMGGVGPSFWIAGLRPPGVARTLHHPVFHGSVPRHESDSWACMLASGMHRVGHARRRAATAAAEPVGASLIKPQPARSSPKPG